MFIIRRYSVLIENILVFFKGFIFLIHLKVSACIVKGTSCIDQYLLYNHIGCLFLYPFCEFLGYFLNVWSILDDIWRFWQILRLFLSFLFLNPQSPKFSWLLCMFCLGVLFLGTTSGTSQGLSYF